MKFTKETLSEAIKAKLSANGKKLSISDRTLNDMINNHYLFVTEETVLDEFVSQVLPVYESLDGNYRKDNADFIKQWEKEHQTPPEKEEKNEKQDATMQAILDRLEKMENERNQELAKRAIADKVAEFKAKVAEKGIKNKEWVDNYTSVLSVKEDSDVEQMAENALKLFNINEAQTGGDILPRRAGGGSEDKTNLFDDIAPQN